MAEKGCTELVGGGASESGQRKSGTTRQNAEAMGNTPDSVAEDVKRVLAK